jgi:hypothetical protein
MNARRENQIAWMLFLGVGMSLVGIFVTMMAFGSAIGMKSTTPVLLIALGPIMIVGGILLAGWGIFAGHMTNRKAENAGARWLSNCYVVGRFAVNQNGEMIFSDFEDLDHPRTKFFVRLKGQDGQDDEFECSQDLIAQIGEGMVGNVQVKGRWLGSFTPVPRA